MRGVDTILSRKQQRKERRLEEEKQRVVKHKTQAELTPSVGDDIDAEDIERDSENSSNNMNQIENIDITHSQSRGTIHLIDDRMLASMDKCKISTRDAMHIVTATAGAIFKTIQDVCPAFTSINLNDLILNRTTIHSMRRAYRRRQAKQIIESFNIPEVFVLHWDGKLLPEKIGTEKQDRLSLVVTCENTEKLLGIPKIERSTGENIAETTYNFLQKWALDSLVEIVSFDTTGSNTGLKNGSAFWLERKLGRKLLFLPCRHHISELLVKPVFEINFGKTSGPENLLFNRFAKHWRNIDTSNFKTGISDEEVLRILTPPQRKYLKEFCMNALKYDYVSADYKELLQLTLLFIGEHDPPLPQFRSPGATSHARFMAKCIYSFKMFLFREQFKFMETELESLRSICLFLATLYVPYWFRCVNAIEAPKLDLDFIRRAVTYYDKDTSKTLLNKIRQHLWYLSEETVGLSFFDETIPLEVKKKMVQKLDFDNEEYGNDDEIKKKIDVTIEEIPSFSDKDISHFVSPRTKRFFTRLSIDVAFLKTNPSEWQKREDYCAGKQVCKHLNVVNDAAERAIKLITDFNNLLTNDEEDKQYLLQVVEHYRRLYPSHTKFSLTNT